MSFFMRLARSSVGSLLLRFFLVHMSFLLPVDAVRKTATLIAFHHPRPSYPFHIVLVPRSSLRRLSDLTPGDSAFMVELFQTVNELVAEFGLEAHGYRLVVNGGRYQEMPHLHFHLVSEGIASQSD